MNLIAGLGNPGTRYIKTRHNIGFRVIEEFARRHKVSLKKKLFGSAKSAEDNFFGKRALLIQPLTYINLSGKCILGYKRKLGLRPEDILVICDDINLPLGTIRIRPQGSSGGHNGLKSVIEELRTEVFPRLKIGIRAEDAPQDISDYVLSDFSNDEIEEVDIALQRAADACESFLRDGIDKTMSIYNK